MVDDDAEPQAELRILANAGFRGVYTLCVLIGCSVWACLAKSLIKLSKGTTTLGRLRRTSVKTAFANRWTAFWTFRVLRVSSSLAFRLVPCGTD